MKEVAFIYLSFWLHRLSLVMGCRLSCSVACETLVPQPRVEPKSACIGRRLLTTGPPGRSRSVCFNSQLLCLIALELPGECSVSAVEKSSTEGFWNRGENGEEGVGESLSEETDL